MKTERELFEAWAKKETNWDLYWSENIKQYMDHQTNGAWLAWQARVPEGYVVVPVEPTEEMWGGLARHLVKYMQSHDRYCPKTLGKYISRFIGFENIPDWLNKEITDWESDHAFATADLGVFIYKAMIEAVEK